ncbi:MAG: DUF5606 domain-containing protein [Bacteroidetes bacterium]|nr:DUF5606 domain-containing protein [Bacteroidota bacterium]MBL6943887.1 DUF5606 domain-containing protein [Bacteroidales bacterium]
MDLSKILSISGKPGLYLRVGEAKNNLIVESLIDGKKIPSFAHDRVSTLKEISVYTESEDVELEKVLKSIFDYTEGKPVENPKKLSNDALKSTFAEILPDYNRDSVYVSDIKKIFSWYNLLLEKDMLDFSEEEEAIDVSNEADDVKKEEENEEKPEEDK